ncbi:hypothetical protein QTV44_002524 [Vibrio vulnificus]|nr:hypothetical protein [Vibrio vulnificus]
MVNTSQIYSDKELLTKLNCIEQLIKVVQSKIAMGTIIEATVAKLPIAAITDDGKDSVYDPIEQIELTYYQGEEAVAEYCRYIQFQTKQCDLSPIGARRLVGTIHLTGSRQYREQLLDSLRELNQSKADYLEALTSTYTTTYERQKFYKAYRPELIPLTITRKLHYPENGLIVSRVYYSWLNKNYAQDTVDYPFVEKLIKSRAKAKVALNPSLDEKKIYDIDLERLAPYGECAHYIWRKPTKLNPRCTPTFLNPETENGIEHGDPIRATLPYLVIQDELLEKYHVLDNYMGERALRVVKGAKRSQHHPILPEYGIFLKNQK